MDILTVSFEDPMIIDISGKKVKLIAFKTQEHGNIKFGVEAPRSVNVHREEIYHAIRQKQLEQEVEEY